MGSEPGGAAREPKLPRPPLSEPVQGETPRHVPLPWNTPAAIALAALVGWLPGSVLALLHVASLGYFRWEDVGRQAWFLAEAVLAGGLCGLGAALADRLTPGWPRALRWALAMAVARALPGRLVVITVLAGHVGRALQKALVQTLWGVGMGVALGSLAQSHRGLRWKLTLAGALVEPVWMVCCGKVTWIASGVAAGFGASLGFLVMASLTLGLGCLRGAAIGFAFAERLQAARRKAMKADV